MSVDTMTTFVDIALLGVRVDAPVTRRMGAGPSDDGHLLVDGANAALPVNPHSPYQVIGGRLVRDGTDLGLSITPVRRPKFYDLTTADGVPYEKIARLHGANVLATTVVQTCIRYAEDQRCRFCTIEESLREGATIAAKTPAQLAEVAEAAVRLDGVTQMVMTTGTTTGPDRGARNLVRSVSAVRRAVPGLPVQVQIEPPGDQDGAQRAAPGRRHRHRHPRRVAGRRGPAALDARQGIGADGRVRSRVGRGGPRLRPQPGFHLPAGRSRRGPGRAGRGRRAADRPRACIPSWSRSARWPARWRCARAPGRPTQRWCTTFRNESLPCSSPPG